MKFWVKLSYPFDEEVIVNIEQVEFVRLCRLYRENLESEIWFLEFGLPSGKVLRSPPFKTRNEAIDFLEKQMASKDKSFVMR